MTKAAEYRLVTYGTLAPGRINHHQLDGLSGTWSKGIIRGCLENEGWGAKEGYPGLRREPQKDSIEAHIFQSNDLPAHWERVDAFEGDGYQRGPITVETSQGFIEASIYFLADAEPSGPPHK